ncbi:hypothetical protein ACFV1C_02650 [Streptomyces sp. NPDC059605]|uniref:hypothetical protein n=1 Tax=unclassified Streptomyces TaxID=2593676 RepID=UPI0036C62478
MTAAPQLATAPVQLALEQRPEWTDWLRSQLDPQWRAGEWDAEQWLFTGDLDSPRTSSSRCRTLRCDAIIRNPASFCNYCRDHRLKSGLPREKFAATFVPDRGQSLRGQVSGQCTITRDGIRCVRPQASNGLCVAHTGSFRYHERRGTLDRWLRELVKPITEELICMVPECSGAAMNSRGLCNYHWRAWSAANRANPDHRVPAEQWASAQPPYLAAHQFTLKLLPELLRWEMRYALQQMDQWVRVLEPHWVRGITRDLADARTLLDDTNTARLNKPHQAAVRTLNNLTSAIHTGYALFTGAKPADEDVIDLRVLGLRHAASGKRRQYPGTVDLRLIPQLWLRHALRHWVTTARPSTEDFKRTLRAARIASTALASRMDAGHDPAALTFTDASAVVDAFRTALRKDGTPYSSSHRRTLNGMFFQLIDYGRRTGSLDELAGPFTRVPVEHAIRIEEQDEDMLGKAVPESVIRQLDAHLDTLGTGPTYGCRDIADEARHLLYRTLYTVLRDTGRRPLEVVSLPRDCLQTHHGQTTLIWNNHKRKRLRRRLPITQATTQAIRVWQARRDQLHLPARGVSPQ